MPRFPRTVDRLTAHRLAAFLGVMLIVTGTVPLIGARVALGTDTTFLAPDNTTAPDGWTGGANATDNSDDGVYATATGDNVDQGYRDFGFAVPAGSIIDGITVKANAFSSDSNGCQLSVRLSWNGGSNFSGYKTVSLTGDAAAILTFGSASDTWSHTWDPTELTNTTFRLQVRNEDPGSACAGTTSLDWITASLTFRTINHGTANPALSGAVCEAADFNFAIDMSGSIGVQGSLPSNLPDLKAGISGFVTAFQNAGGDGRYSGTRFSGSTAATMTGGYTDAATFSAAVAALSTPSGATPTAAGIGGAAANNTHDRAGIPNILFVVTDGSPNVPSSWLEAANAAVAAADAARAGSGASSYVVKAVYMSTAGDPGDSDLPFSPAGDSQWAQTVMNEIGGGSHLDADFTAFVNDLFSAIGCPPPSTTIAKVADHATVDAGDQIGFTLTVTNSGGKASHDVVVDDTLPGAAGLDWALSPAVTGCAITGSPGSQTLHCALGTLAAGAHQDIHVVSGTPGYCGVVNNTATFGSSDNGTGEASDSVNVRCASIHVTKVADDASVSAQDAIGFTITVTSGGPGAAKGVVLTDTLPTDAGTSWSVNGGTGAAMCAAPVAGVLTCTFGEMANGASYTVHVTSPTTKATLADSPVSNTAVVNTTNDGSDEATASVAVLPGSIHVTKVADDASVSAQDAIGFTITVTSGGPGAAKGVVLTDTLPTDAGTSWSVNGGTGAAMCAAPVAGVLTCTFGEMANGASYTVHVTSPTTKATLADSPVSNTAVVNTTNDGSDEATASVAVLPGSIHVTKVADDASVSAQDAIGFTITVTSGGPGAAKGVVLTDTLPTDAGTSWSVNGGTGAAMCAAPVAGVLTCTFGEMANGASYTVHVTSPTTKATLADSPVSNTAVVNTTNDGSDEATASVAVLAPDLEIVKLGSAPVSAGETASFTITVTNHGPGVARNVTLSDQLAAGSWSIGGVNAASCSINGTNLLTCNFESMTSGTSRSISVSRTTAPADCGGTIDNNASVAASNEDTATDQYANLDDAAIIVNCPDLTVQKTGNGPVSAGEVVSFTIVVTNLGPGAASQVTLDDPLPAGISWAVGGANAGDCEIAAGKLTCSFGTLAAGATRTVTLSGETDAATCGSVVNTATVGAANEPAGAIGNNASRASVTVSCPALLITKTADAPQVMAGGQIGFTVEVTNSGDGSTFGLAVDDILPVGTGLGWTIASGSAGWAIVGGHLTWGPGTLPAHSTITVHIVSPTGTASCATVANTASFVTANDGTGSDDASVDVLCAGMTVVKTAAGAADGAELVTHAGNVTFTYVVTNTGSANLVDIAVVDDHGTPADASDDVPVTCPKTTLAAGESMTCTAVLPVGVGVTTNVASVTAHPAIAPDALVAAHDDAVVRVPALTIGKDVTGYTSGNIGGVPQAAEADVLTYTLAYDLAAGPVTNGVIEDELPVGLEYLAGAVTSNSEFTFIGYTPSTRVLRWQAATVTADGSVTYQVRVVLDASKLDQPLVNTATISSDQTAPSTGDQSLFVAKPPLGETGTPVITPPPTDGVVADEQAAGGNLLQVLLVLAGLAFLALVATPRRRPVRSGRDREG